MVFATWVDSLEATLDEFVASDAASTFADLTLVDLNPVLFRSDGEERDARTISLSNLPGMTLTSPRAVGGEGVYAVPGLGPLLYCGFQGWMPHVQHIMEQNDLGHPLAAHLRDGAWALDYVHGRLEK